MATIQNGFQIPVAFLNQSPTSIVYSPVGGAKGRAACNFDATIFSCNLMKSNGWIIEIATNLVLNVQNMCISCLVGQLVLQTPSCHKFLLCYKQFREKRKGSSKLLETMITKLSFVTDFIAGPRNCPFINKPCLLIEIARL